MPVKEKSSILIRKEPLKSHPKLKISPKSHPFLKFFYSNHFAENRFHPSDPKKLEVYLWFFTFCFALRPTELHLVASVSISNQQLHSAMLRGERLIAIPYYQVPSLKLTANAPENRPSQKETSMPTIHF